MPGGTECHLHPSTEVPQLLGMSASLLSPPLRLRPSPSFALMMEPLAVGTHVSLAALQFEVSRFSSLLPPPKYSSNESMFLACFPQLHAALQFFVPVTPFGMSASSRRQRSLLRIAQDWCPFTTRHIEGSPQLRLSEALPAERRHPPGQASAGAPAVPLFAALHVVSS